MTTEIAIKCEPCHGYGKIKPPNEDEEPCPYCKGKGITFKSFNDLMHTWNNTSHDY